MPKAVSANEINRNGAEKVTRTARILDSLETHDTEIERSTMTSDIYCNLGTTEEYTRLKAVLRLRSGDLENLKPVIGLNCYLR